MNITLRKVQTKDWDYILNLRNDLQFRSFFYNQETISKEEHYNYLKKQNSNPNFFNWIICLDDKDVGYIRILDHDIGIIISSENQKKGIGDKVLKLIEIEARNLGLKKLIGKIMIHNKSSEKIFLKNNYQLKMFWYEKNLEAP